MAKASVSGRIELEPKKRWLGREIPERMWRTLREVLSNLTETLTNPQEAAVVAAVVEAIDAAEATRPERDPSVAMRLRFPESVGARKLMCQSPRVASALDGMPAVLKVAGREAQSSCQAAAVRARESLELCLEEPGVLEAWEALGPWADRAMGWDTWRAAAKAEVQALRAVWKRWKAGADRCLLDEAWVTWNTAWTFRLAQAPGSEARKRAKRRKARKAAEAAEQEALSVALDVAWTVLEDSMNDGASTSSARLALEEALAARQAALAIKAAWAATRASDTVRKALSTRLWSYKSARETLSASGKALSAVRSAAVAVGKASAHQGGTATEENEALAAVAADVAATQAAWNSTEKRHGKFLRQAARSAVNVARETGWKGHPPAEFEAAILGQAEPWEAMADRATRRLNHRGTLHEALVLVADVLMDLSDALLDVVEGADALEAVEQAVDARNEARETREVRLAWMADSLAWKVVAESGVFTDSSNETCEFLVECVDEARIEAGVASEAAARVAVFSAVKAADALDVRDALDAETREWVDLHLEAVPPALEAALEVEPDARLVAALEAVRADPYLDDPCLNDSRLTVLGAALERERAARAKFWPVRLLELEMDTALAQERAALEEAEAKALEAAAGLTGIGVRLRSAIPAG